MGTRIRGRYSCNGKPSPSNYGNGCRCAKCREAHREYNLDISATKRKRRSGTRRDNPIAEHDAFTREQILLARRD